MEVDVAVVKVKVKAEIKAEVAAEVKAEEEEGEEEAVGFTFISTYSVIITKQ